MRIFFALTKRNIKLFFKDKGMFLTSLITPLILLVLYVTFLGNLYEQSYTSLGEGMFVSDKLIDGLVGGQLLSSILSVSCVTVAFSSNFLMVQDKALGNIKDIKITPVNPKILALSYYFASLISTLIICFTALGAGLIYLSFTAWYLSFSDVMMLVLDVFLLVMFGTGISSIINYFLSSQGQISAVGSIVSSCYGFICGAYMPIATFGTGLQKVLSFLPGTYATSLLRTHALQGAFKQMESDGIPSEMIDAIKDSLDINVSFFSNEVSQPVKLLILGGFTILSIVTYVMIHKIKSKKI